MNFYSSVIFQDKRFKSVQRINDLDLLEPIFRKQIINILLKGAELGLNLAIYETYRSKQRQELLFDQDMTQLKEVGVHHFGLACDIVRVIDGRYSWENLSDIAPLAKANTVIWGGDWGTPEKENSFRDEAHFQRCTVYRQHDLLSFLGIPMTIITRLRIKKDIISNLVHHILKLLKNLATFA